MRRTFRLGSFGVTVEAPDRVAAAFRRLRPGSSGTVAVPQAEIEFLHPVPQPRTVQRDPVHALDLFRVPPGHEPPSWTPQLKDIPPGTEDLAARVREIVWYHSIELPGGLVTPGAFDHRPLAPHYGFPSQMAGMTALDVATFDGFWAFELERRGAEVTAVDLDTMIQADFPPQAREQAAREGVDVKLGAGFELARSALGSKVKRVVSNVYDLDPSTLGTFDVVHVGDLLIHLERPLAALRAIRSVTRGSAYIAELFLTDLPQGRGLVEYVGGWDDIIWWRHTMDALGQMIIDAGFRAVRTSVAYRMAKTWQTQQVDGAWRAVFVAEV